MVLGSHYSIYSGFWPQLQYGQWFLAPLWYLQWILAPTILSLVVPYSHYSIYSGHCPSYTVSTVSLVATTVLKDTSDTVYDVFWVQVDSTTPTAEPDPHSIVCISFLASVN